MLCARRVRAWQTDPRQTFVFHIYVDPIYGDDALAGNSVTAIWKNNQSIPVPPFNPQGTTQEPLSPHTQDSTWQHLQHAPFSFRTLTGAAAWFRGRFTLPYTTPQGYVVPRVVYHCLPGLYGPTTPTKIDPRTGLAFNGETWPFQLMDRESIQGTSALDTVFDARQKVTYVIRISGTTNPNKEFHSKSFIDSVTIRGARTGTGVMPQGAGIALISGLTEKVIISNCFITDNKVGIAIESMEPKTLTTIENSPVIVNNTIAWNQIGVWSGPFVLTAFRTGYSRPRLLNNIIDSRDVLGRWGAAGTSAFEGVDPTDLTVQSLGSTQVNIDYNAYDPTNCNRQVAFGSLPGVWPALTTRTANPTYSPRIVMPSSPTDYQIYVNEILFAKEGSLTTSGLFVDSRSPHDFRLSPVARTGGQAMLNPMVAMGVDTSLGTIRFQNYKPTISPDITRAPGFTGPGDEPLDTQFAQIHAWDWDCEGFGNPRIWARSGFQTPPQYSTHMDLGADELGELVMAGYIDKTRIFSRLVPDGLGQGGQLAIPDHTQVYFLNLPASLGGPSSYLRPQFSTTTGGRIATGLDYTWWHWAQGTSNSMWLFQYKTSSSLPLVTSNYTVGDGAMFRSLNMAAVYPLLGLYNKQWEPFMRNLECDFAPTLLLDTVSGWASYFNSGSTFGPNKTDEFGSHPWHHHTHVLATAQPTPIDNHHLYYMPTHPTLPSAVVEGTLNPPATWAWIAGLGYIGSFVSGQFGPFGYPGTSNYTVDAFGIGDGAPGPDVIPDSAWLGMRYNCETPVGGSLGSCNLQTFLAINGQPPVSAKAAQPPARPKKLREIGIEDYRKALGRTKLLWRKK